MTVYNIPHHSDGSMLLTIGTYNIKNVKILNFGGFDLEFRRDLDLVTRYYCNLWIANTLKHIPTYLNYSNNLRSS
jgi:hypothetical protein